ncbi:hypothetical protein I4U23_028547 [Adineta vaga]|nr:hypothetical protein I4U23_028547 [Adineta vaga]
MATIILTVFTLCLLSTLSAEPIPGIVFSAVVRNIRNIPVDCSIGWGTFSVTAIPNEIITIPSNQQTIVNEKIVDMGTWTAGAFIESITCGDLGLIAPFPKVTKTQRCWQFNVEPNKLVSVGPGSCK